MAKIEQPPEVNDDILNNLWANADDLPDDDFDDDASDGDDDDIELALSGFDPNQPRDENGQWADDGGVVDTTEEWTEEIGKAWDARKSKAMEKFSNCTKENQNVASSVFNYMNDECLDRFIANTTKVLEFVSEDELTEYYTTGGGFSNAPAGCKVQGSYATDGTLRLDGATGEKREIYAHEFGHAIDRTAKPTVTGYKERVSNTWQWMKAWSEEIKTTNNLSEYAKTSKGEGFAEFARLVFSMPREARREFPQCYKVWKQNGLVDK